MLRQQVRSDRGPNRALLRLLVDKYTHLVVYVDEYYTSQGRDANSATNVRHALMEMLLGRARPAALRRGGDGGGGGGPGLTSSSSGGSSNSGSSNSGSSSSGTGPGSSGTGPSSCGVHVRSGGGEQGHVEDGGERGAAQEAAPVLRWRPAGVWLGSLLASIAQLSM
ncbi:hypothetical protein CHLRE_02g086350v5 [Chlamydomonas reinhardtii]|uniref:Uncharacterized protein n=1 Tax=Chlamydomonas reinhardtii TaxID=3055 RepID=A0A2K3E0X3_CHLRE|nr:uncharacterized protein CHLRE_02g086350v5 [Chlamydomonas reinhardtii]PNW86436.1 hypothetical protein CHLRE_02g086350v5 [Chlamydomonas reinhardtii]